MKQRLSKIVSALLVATMCLSVIAIGVYSPYAAEVDNESVSASAIKSRDEAVAWLRAQEGARYDIDGAYGSQCSDFTSAYVNYVLTGNPYGGRIGVYNANQYSNANLYPSDWQVFANTPSFLPEPGDIFVVNGADARYGHTGVVISSDIYTATIADQNGMSDWSLDYGSPAHIHNITWTSSGTWAAQYYIRPCFSSAFHNPEGVVDVIEGGEGKVHVRGWAFDRDDFGNQIPIHVYIGGRSGDSNAECHAITANTQRPDVNAVYGCGDWHGFDAEITTSKRGNQPVHIYALNIGPGNNNPQIGEGTANVKEPNVPASSVTLNKTTLILEISKSDTLTSTVYPANATDKTVNWTSSDTKVATVTNGKVTAVSAGTATITAKTTNGKTATCSVTVKAADVAVTDVTLNKTTLSLEIGKSETLTATVLPSNATEKAITWVSNNTKVATVANGKVTAVAAGTATITAKTTNGKTAICQVTVKNNANPNAPILQVESKSAKSGNSIAVKVLLKNNPGIWGLDAKLNYDKSVLTLTDVTNGDVFSSGEWTQGDIDSGQYTLSYEASGFDNVSKSGTLATLLFKVNDNAKKGTETQILLSYNEGDIISANFEDVHFETIAGTIKICDFIYGDINGDGAVNKKDSLLLKMYLANNKTEIDKEAADVFPDGNVNKKDSLYLKQYLAGLNVILGQ